MSIPSDYSAAGTSWRSRGTLNGVRTEIQQPKQDNQRRLLDAIEKSQSETEKFDAEKIFRENIILEEKKQPGKFFIVRVDSYEN